MPGHAGGAAWRCRCLLPSTPVSIPATPSQAGDKSDPPPPERGPYGGAKKGVSFVRTRKFLGVPPAVQPSPPACGDALVSLYIPTLPTKFSHQNPKSQIFRYKFF